MTASDPIDDLVHDHAELNQLLLAASALVARIERQPEVPVAALVDPLTQLRELLFPHFAREEEGLFPFVASVVPRLAPQIEAMESAHDAICGGLARAIHLASVGGERATLLAVFERFEFAYSEHARSEATLLESLAGALDAEERVQLAERVRGL